MIQTKVHLVHTFGKLIMLRNFKFFVLLLAQICIFGQLFGKSNFETFCENEIWIKPVKAILTISDNFVRFTLLGQTFQWLFRY